MLSLNLSSSKILPLLITSTLVGSVMFAPKSQAVSFGVYDARTLALGGTSVALGTVEEGHLYNPALTALHEGDEDETRDGAYIFPLVATVSDAAKSAADAIRDDLEGELTQAIETFNANPSVETAIQGIGAAEDLQDLLEDLQDREILLDTVAGVAISEPGDREGGGFYAGFRFIGSGISEIAEDDITVLNDYIDALQFISTGGAQGEENPQLFDAGGMLANPNDTFTSLARGQALLIAEVAVSLAKQFDLWGQPIALGITPKVLALTIFEGEWMASNGNFSSEDEDDASLQFNSDLGAVATFDDVWRVGLTVKDIIPTTVNTNLGNTFRLKPRARMGLAYVGSHFQIGMDADLTANPVANTDLNRRDISIGAEVSIAKGWSLRAGYRQDLEDVAGSATSFGASLRLTRLRIDATLLTGDDQKGGALQLSWAQ